MNKKNKLTLAKIDKKNSSLDRFQEIKICDEGYDVTIRTIFKESLIKRVVMNYFKAIQELRKLESVNDEIIADTVGLLNVFILKEFSDVPFPKDENLHSLISVANVLLDTGILAAVLDKYPQEELEKVGAMVQRVSKTIGENLGELAVRDALDQIENETGESDGTLQ